MILQCADNLGVAVALIHGGIGRQKVVVTVAINVPDTSSYKAEVSEPVRENGTERSG